MHECPPRHAGMEDAKPLPEILHFPLQQACEVHPSAFASDLQTCNYFSLRHSCLYAHGTIC